MSKKFHKISKYLIILGDSKALKTNKLIGVFSISIYNI